MWCSLASPITCGLVVKREWRRVLPSWPMAGRGAAFEEPCKSGLQPAPDAAGSEGRGVWCPDVSRCQERPAFKWLCVSFCVCFLPASVFATSLFDVRHWSHFTRDDACEHHGVDSRVVNVVANTHLTASTIPVTGNGMICDRIFSSFSLSTLAIMPLLFSL